LTQGRADMLLRSRLVHVACVVAVHCRALGQ